MIKNDRIYGIIGSVIGDIAGSRFEFEKGFSNTHPNGFSHLPLQKGFPIHVIGTSMEVVKKDVKDLIAKVKNEPETTFIIENVGLSKKINIGAETMAPIFAPLKDKENVYFVKDYWDYYKKWI